MEADNRKRKGEDLEHDRLKKQRLIENSETNCKIIAYSNLHTNFATVL
jgi:hypothetical protein